MVKVGDKVRDRVTGFKGVAVCRTEWLNGCVRIGVQPASCYTKDGETRMPEISTIDEGQLDIVKAHAVLASTVTRPRTSPIPDLGTGGDHEASPQQPEMTR